MNYEPPGNRQNETNDYRNKNNNASSNKNNSYYSRPRNSFLNSPPDCSPLLRTPSQETFSESNRNGFLNSQNTASPLIGPQDFKAPIYNRLGRNNYQSRSYNKSDLGNDTTSDNNFNPRKRFNRKRSIDGGSGPNSNPKRRWNSKPYLQNSNSNQHTSNIAQNRMDKLRSSSTTQLDIKEDISVNDMVIKVENSIPPPLDDSQDIDATDITVEIINDGNTKPIMEDLSRFKMILNEKAQAAIKTIQQKRKDKQVIFPFPVTPNVTEMSLHERFTSL